MENIETEESFICFDSGDLKFIVPVYNVVRILSYEEGDLNANSEYNASAFEELPILDFRRKREKDKKYRSVIVLQYDYDIFGLAVDEVEDLIQIKPENQYEIPQILCDSDNSYIGGVSYLPERKRLLFLLDGNQLKRYIPKSEEITDGK
ncbi:MAG: hypothetical protein EOM40_13400 [Clostridia bacterium]|nr:hypothetical protein [Clostridia bacterium]NCC43397.1 hypothetical protein [Clostridia bacterium]